MFERRRDGHFHGRPDMSKTDSYAALTYAVRPAVVAKYLGQLSLVLAALSLVPMAVGFYFGEPDIAWRYLAVAAALAALGAATARGATPAQLQANEALAITALAYLLGTLANAYPMMGCGLGMENALFEAVSGITTTGLSTVAVVEAMPRTFLFTRAWAQWYGGLGIAVLSLAMLTSYDLAARRLVEPPASGDSLVTTTLNHARRVTLVYGILTVLGIAVLMSLGMDASAAVGYALAAISTGGFALHDAGLGALGRPLQEAAVLGVALLGAVSLPLYHAAWRRNWRRVMDDIELRGLLLAILVVTLLLFACNWMAGDHGLHASTFDLFLLGISAQSTTGFSTLPVVQLDPASKWVLMGAMAIGGSAGSTAGGIKLFRFLLVLRLLQLLLRRLSMSGHAVVELTLGARRVESETVMRALVLVLLFVAAALASWLPFLAAGYDPLNALFEVVSALGTVGLSTGVTGSQLEPGLKAVLCLDMLFGRVEFIAMLILFSPATWWGKRMAEAQHKGDLL